MRIGWQRALKNFSALMAKIVIIVPDEYTRIEGIVEIFGRSIVDDRPLQYQNFILDRDLLPGDLVQISFSNSI